MILLLWILNFGISWLNAWGCGKTWNETKANGGVPHFMNWMGAVMSASGFSWCYMVIVAFLGSVIPITNKETGVSAPLLTPHMLEVFCNLGYLAIILPILGSGLAITIHSWGVFWRRRNFLDGATAGYNTFAQVYNFYGAFRHVPDAGLSVKDFFFGDKDSRDSKAIVFALVAFSVIGGILTTYFIVKSVAKSTALNRGMFYSNRVPA